MKRPTLNDLSPGVEENQDWKAGMPNEYVGLLNKYIDWLEGNGPPANEGSTEKDQCSTT